MRGHVRWTPELDDRLRGLRSGGMTWDGIAGSMGLGRNTVLERGRKIGARRLLPRPAPVVEEARDRAARQAGHPETWGLITAGTVLDGEAYPYRFSFKEQIMNMFDGADSDPGCGSVAQRARPLDAAFIIRRLEEAGSTLLALPGTGYSTRLKVSHLEVVQEACAAFGGAAEQGQIRPPVPSAARISRMDEALGWIAFIPRDRVVLRRIVGARSLVSPVTERHLFSWRRLGGVMGADHKAVQRWHAQGIEMLVVAVGALE